MEQATTKAPELIPGGMTTNCMLVRVRVTGWDARRKDKALTAETAERAGVDQGKKDRIRVYKTLIDPERITSMSALENAIRSFLYAKTMPWLDDGQRLITAKSFPEFNRTIHRMIEAYKIAADELVADYPMLKAQARLDLNGAYNEKEYPSQSEVRDKYSAEISYSPVPTSGDIRVAIQDDALAKIRAELEERERAAMGVAMKDLWTRIHAAVGRMAERLDDPKKTFHDTLVGNLLELVNLLPELNWTEDQELEKARREIEAKLCAYEPEQLRKDERARKETGKAAAELAQVAKTQLDALEDVLGGIL